MKNADAKPGSFNNRGFVNSLVALPQNPDVLASLRRLDLNQYEAMTYYALTLSGECTAGELAANSKVPRPRGYDVLNSLAEKGFVAISPSRPVRYRAVPLSEAVKTLRKKRADELSREMAAIESIAGDLSNKLSGLSSEGRTGPGDAVWTLRGRSAIYSRMAEMLEAAKQHVVISTTPAGLARKLSEHDKILEKARSRGVKVHIMAPVTKEKISELSRVAHKVHSLQLPTRMVVADDQALLFLTGEDAEPEDELGVWIHNPHVASTLRRLVPAAPQ